jgi:D-alanyl-D-alanine carboxypeptidase/D-alanyl-D-alanine-endopeptidase (penicillin-binding protein 4)
MRIFFTISILAVAQATVPAVDTVRSWIDSPRFSHATWSAHAVSLASGEELLSVHADRLVTPASTAKLYTAALAIVLLGPDHVIETPVFAGGEVDASGVLRGDLVVRGAGDFSFSARFEGGSENALSRLVDAISAAGVKRVSGDLVGEEGFFNASPHGRGWAHEDLQYYYGAPVSALGVDDNVLDFEVVPGARIGDLATLVVKQPVFDLVLRSRVKTASAGGDFDVRVSRPFGTSVVTVSGEAPLGGRGYADAVAVPDPGRWFVQRLGHALEKHGIEIGGSVRVTGDRRELAPLCSAASPPLHELVRVMMRDSQNMYAQALLLHAERAATADLALRIRDGDYAAMDSLLRECGIAAHEARIEEGAGLSRGTIVSARSLTRLLARMHRHEHASVFRSVVPEATFLDGVKLRAKTGGMRGIAGLAGYAEVGGDEIAFAVLLNHCFPEDGSSPMAAVREAVRRMLEPKK